MTLQVKHTFTSPKADGLDPTQVQPSHWNATHTITLVNHTIVGRNTAGDGAAEEVTSTQFLDWIGSARGSILFRGAATWSALGPGTAGQVLVSQGASADPVWGTGIPTGAVTAFAANSAPTGWVICDGSAVSRTTYAALFAIISTTYGAGDGSTTFNLPDLRGAFLRGFDDGRGLDSGRVFGSYQADAFASHNHTATVTDPGHNHLVNLTSSAPSGAGGTGGVNNSITYNTNYSVTGISVSISSSGGTETRPKNVAMIYIIKV